MWEVDDPASQGHLAIIVRNRLSNAGCSCVRVEAIQSPQIQFALQVRHYSYLSGVVRPAVDSPWIERRLENFLAIAWRDRKSMPD